MQIYRRQLQRSPTNFPKVVNIFPYSLIQTANFWKVGENLFDLAKINHPSQVLIQLVVDGIQ